MMASGVKTRVCHRRTGLRSRRSCRLAAIWCAMLGMAFVGCAQPRGALFKLGGSARVWPRAPEAARIKWVGALGGSDDLNAGIPAREAWAAAFRGPRPPIRFSGPHSIAISEGGLLAVADGAAASVHVVDLDERTHRVISGWGEERFDVPIGVAWVGHRLFVTDAKRHEVIELDIEGNFRGRFGRDHLTRPVGITHVPASDRLCVVDGGGHCLRMFDTAGTLTNTLGERGSTPGAFNFPSHVCCAGDRLIVSDSGNFRVQLLDLRGAPLGMIGRKGDGAGDLSLPKGVAVDSAGHIYVVDAHFENVQVFDDSGRLLMSFGQEGRGDGEFWLPAGIAIDGNDRIWVADSGNRRVQAFQPIRDEE